MRGTSRLVMVVSSLWLLFPIGLSLFCLAMPAYARRQGRQDNKSAAELELMDETELAREALNACSRANEVKPYVESSLPSLQMRGYQAVSEASEYLQTIERVARKAHQGSTPKWTLDMQTALFAGDYRQCLNISSQVHQDDLNRRMEEHTKEMQKSQPAKSKQKVKEIPPAK